MTRAPFSAAASWPSVSSDFSSTGRPSSDNWFVWSTVNGPLMFGTLGDFWAKTADASVSADCL